MQSLLSLQNIVYLCPVSIYCGQSVKLQLCAIDICISSEFEITYDRFEMTVNEFEMTSDQFEMTV